MIHEMWLNLEAGVARSLNRLHDARLSVPVHSDTRSHGDRALIVEAANSVLPEAAVQTLPPLARGEVATGKSGVLREQIAATDDDDAALVHLRDELVARLGGSADGVGAIRLTDRVYLGRLVQGHVPPIVGVGCVGWYGHWRSHAGPSLDTATALAELWHRWIDQPSQRGQTDAAILDLARRAVGADISDLISAPV